MTIRDILVWPSKKLIEPVLPVEDVADVDSLVWDLMDTMAEHKGAGIAAPQIGESVSIFLVMAGMGSNQVFINPEITWVSEDKVRDSEGCLSFPGVWVVVERPARCRVKALNEMGNEFEVEAEDIYARVIQHEFDHLNGALIVDFVGKVKRDMIRKKMKKKKK